MPKYFLRALEYLNSESATAWTSGEG